MTTPAPDGDASKPGNADFSLALLQEGVDRWNRYRSEHSDFIPNIAGRDLSAESDFKMDIVGADLRGLQGQSANLCYTYLRDSNFDEANFRDAQFISANLSRASMRGADLRGADLSRANLWRTDLTGANLRGAKLIGTSLVETNLNNAKLDGCAVYGCSVWRIQVDAGTSQSDLAISPPDERAITVDNLKVAQFVYLLLENRELRNVLDSISSKAVVILGRFTPERMAVLQALREELRARNYLPVLFDFDKPANRDLTETVSTLAHMARFVIADITDARSIPQELMAIVPNLPSVPVQPILLASQQEYGMFEHFRRYPWVLEPFLYKDQEALLAALTDRVVAPAEAMAHRQTRST